jgi:hypothetical protein
VQRQHHACANQQVSSKCSVSTMHAHSLAGYPAAIGLAAFNQGATLAHVLNVHIINIYATLSMHALQVFACITATRAHQHRRSLMSTRASMSRGCRLPRPPAWGLASCCCRGLPAAAAAAAAVADECSDCLLISQDTQRVTLLQFLSSMGKRSS